MNNAPVLYLMMGLLFGTTFLALGIALGLWIAKRPHLDPTYTPKSPSPSLAETQQLLNVLRSVATLTTEFSGDFTRYQSTLSSLSRKAADGKTVRTKEEVQSLLDQILAANEQLQSRLDNAEQKLENQTKQLAGYLSEARTDGLTGLANRRAFDQKIDECFNQWSQTKKSFSLALIDIDHFKKINDTYGHPAGDAVLREVASRLKDYSSESLLIARYGGEEFALLFAGNANEAASVMEKIRIGMASKTVAAEGHEIKVTLSCGVSQIAKEDRIGKLVRRSDEALYTAKMAGRNRVFVHNGTICEVYGSPSAEPIVSAGVKPESILPTGDPVEQRILHHIDQILAERR